MASQPIPSAVDVARLQLADILAIQSNPENELKQVFEAYVSRFASGGVAPEIKERLWIAVSQEPVQTLRQTVATIYRHKVLSQLTGPQVQLLLNAAQQYLAGTLEQTLASAGVAAEMSIAASIHTVSALVEYHSILHKDELQRELNAKRQALMPSFDAALIFQMQQAGIQLSST